MGDAQKGKENYSSDKLEPVHIAVGENRGQGEEDMGHWLATPMGGRKNR